ncbi:MAG: toll/interleukin-1 receptor domain-containing protein [Planctomycetes bacterium]|nr:toll/interleukin-1 receptor domain-containing protein [Planctomycetota bacterium]
MKVFISYRRSDSVDIAGRLADRLADKLGLSNVFLDAASLAGGASWPQAINEEVEQCDVMLAVIGPNWSKAADDHGRRRIDHPDDWVRREIETALQKNIPVIPVLVSDTSMPAAAALPESLRDLANKQAAQIRSGPDFHSDSDRLIEALMRLGSKVELEAKVLEEVRVFVSHSTLDRKWVEAEVVKTLNRKGIHANSAKSDWVHDEVYWAIFNRPSKIVTVIMDECNLWDFHIRIPRLQHIDFRRKLDEARKTLLRVFGRG